MQADLSATTALGCHPRFNSFNSRHSCSNRAAKSRAPLFVVQHGAALQPLIVLSGPNWAEGRRPLVALYHVITGACAPKLSLHATTVLRLCRQLRARRKGEQTGQAPCWQGGRGRGGERRSGCCRAVWGRLGRSDEPWVRGSGPHSHEAPWSTIFSPD